MSETATQPAALLTPTFMHQLDRLDVMSRKILRGKLQGEKRSKQRGQSVEFADYRNYVTGDGLRFIDWNLFARLDKLFLRLFMEEQDLAVSIMFDVSQSMDYGDPNKLLYAKQITAALAYIGLVHHNRVSVHSFADDLIASQRHMRGRRPIPQMLSFIANQQPIPASHFAAAAKRFNLLERGKGLVIVISDFFDKGDLLQGLSYLSGERFDVYAVQVLSPSEIDPSKGGMVGDMRLTDIEDGDVADVSLTPALLKRYQATLQAYCQHVRGECLKRGMAYLFSDTSVPFQTLVLQYLRERGLLV